MSRKQLLLFGGIGFVALVLIVFLTWLGISNQAANTAKTQGVTYTDDISGQTLTTFPSTEHADNDSAKQATNDIAITGMDDFFSGIDQDQAQSILGDITTFIRARTGTAAGVKAAVLNGKVNQTGSNTYQFVLVLLNPAGRYGVTITLPANASTPDVTFGGVTP